LRCESEIGGADFGSGKPREEDLVENRKLRYFNPFEFFDHTGIGWAKVVLRSTAGMRRQEQGKERHSISGIF
jgi:hypothetical protein